MAIDLVKLGQLSFIVVADTSLLLKILMRMSKWLIP